ncbi:alpha/beta hydrolase family protein [Actinophytocola sediminis]
MRGRTIGTALTVTLTLALLAVQSTASSAEDPAKDTVTQPAQLPAPTGSHPVGTTALYLKDTSRPDPWVPSVAYRELMVQLFYPTADAHGQTKQHLTVAEARAVLEEAEITTVPAELLAATRTNAVVDARPVGRAHSRPLIVLSPGFKRPRHTLSALAEDLASHGNIVVVVDHTYENVATTFPDGRVTPCTACGSYDEAFWLKLERGRATDVSFVLDELTGRHPKWRGAAMIDPSRIAMGGHSVGGAASLVTLATDHRVLAGVDIDGSTLVPLPEAGLAKPFLFLGRADAYTPGTGGAAESWERDWELLTGWRRWLVVEGMVHPSFTDIGLVMEQLGLDTGAETPADRGQAITRAYVRAFFDLHLRDIPQPLLTTPSPTYPEVTFIG